VAAFRYDTARFGESDWEVTPEGYLYVRGCFARDGVLEYRNPNGSVRRELRLPETNRNPEVLTGFASKPVTVEHPPEPVNAHNSHRYQVGAIDPEVVREERYEGGFVTGVVRIYRADAVEAIRSGGKRELSIGYAIDLIEKPGVWKNPYTGEEEPYDAIQDNVRVNHLALTAKGRAGSDCSLRIDSADSDIAIAADYLYRDDSRTATITSETAMATIRLDHAELQVDPPVAAAVNEILNERQRLREDSKSLREEIAELRQRLDSAESQRDEEEARAATLEAYLEELRNDMATSMPMSKVKLDEDDEDYEEDSGDEDMPPRKKTKGKKKKPCPNCAEAMKEDCNDGDKRRDSDDEDEEYDDSEEYYDDDSEAFDDEDEEYDDDSEYEEEEYDDEEDDGEYEYEEGDDVRADSVQDILSAWELADRAVPGIRYDSFDPNFSSRDVRILALCRMDSDLSPTDFDSHSDAYIEGVFDAVLEDELDEEELEEIEEYTARTDSYSSPLEQAVAASRRQAAGPMRGEGVEAYWEKTSQAWQEPLSQAI
jgi:hypothetical protein